MEPVFVGIDRDGTINKDVGYLGKDPKWKSRLELLPGVIDGIKLLNSNKRIKLAVATNQAGIARGFFGSERVVEINSTIDLLLRTQGAKIHNWQYCPFVSPEYALEKGIPKDNEWVRSMSQFDGLRKPGAGMLRKAAEEMGYSLEDFARIYFIGDKVDDAMAGVNAGGIGILLSPRGQEAEKDIMKDETGRIVVARSFYDACKWITEDLQCLK